ncbi:MAG: hypothetical protein IPK07_29615 [Deltaproteobacteria bacterium]|nr:hypothetical protein [Deltaproteobacteria bacterium]
MEVLPFEGFPSSHYLGRLALPFVVLFAAYCALAAIIAWVCGRAHGTAAAAPVAVLLAFGLAVLWEQFLLVLYSAGPISGCPDGGMFSGFFVLQFLHGPYVIEYVGMPLLARVVFHLAGGVGFAAAGFAAGRLHWAAAIGGSSFVIPYAVWRSAPMWYTVTGYEAYRPATVGEAISLGWRSALEAAALIAVGAAAANWRRRSGPNQPLKPTALRAAA